MGDGRELLAVDEEWLVLPCSELAVYPLSDSTEGVSPSLESGGLNGLPDRSCCSSRFICLTATSSPTISFASTPLSSVRCIWRASEDLIFSPNPSFEEPVPPNIALTPVPSIGLVGTLFSFEVLLEDAA